VPANTSETVACYADIVLPAPPAVNDHCGNPITPTGPVESTPPACEGDITYTWTYTDCEGNTHDWVHTVTIEREDFTVPANTSETVACYADIVLPAPPAVNDHCGNPITPTGPVESTPPACEGDITYTWTYTDCEGNTHDWIHTVTIEREDFTVPANTSETVACYADIVLPAPPAVNDHCGNPITPTGPVESTPPACEGDITYTWTYTDCEGNTHDWVHTVTIEREDFTVPANTSETVACYADIVLPAPPAVNDHCGNPITPTGPVESTPPACEGDITYTWTYTDCEGNTHDWVHTVTIEREDFTVPTNTSETVACYADIVLPAPPAVNDHCGNPITPTGPVESTPPACEGDITYTWTYTDCEGNTHDWIHTVTIEREDFTVPANTSETVACYADIVLPAPPAVNDHCGNPITPTGPVESTPPACEGDITYTWTYTDCEGNTHDWVHTVTIEREDFTVPANTSETVACYADIVLPAPPAVNDHCGNPITPTGPVESTPPACEGDITYTWTYTDCEGNTHDWVHTVTIEREDFTVPANTSETVACYADIVLPAPPAVNDHCGNPITPTGPVESTPPACEGDITYTWTYTDCEGNTHDWVHTVTIEREDFTVPANTSETVACYADIVLPAPPAVNDHCGNPITPTGPVESTPPACEGDITYTWTYTDCEGNTHDWVHTVTIEREDFTVPANTSETVTCYADIVLPAPPAVNDHCGNPITPTGPVESTPPACEGDITYTWTYTDCEGNTHDWIHTVTIEREDFTVPANTSETVACYADIVLPAPPAVNDHCGNPITPTGPVESTPPACEGDITYTWTYTDCEGNTHDWVHTVTIEREDFTVPANTSETVACYADIVLPAPPAVNDHCGNPITPTGPVESTPPACEGDITYTWTYTDCEGNTHDWVHTVTIEREDFTVPANTSETVACYADIVLPAPPAVNDHCGNPITPTGPVESTPPACEGDITYTWTYTDCEGNTHDWIHTVTIEREDFTVPANTSETVACYADIVLPAPPAVNDHCGNPITPTGPVESTPPACEGDITYTWTYTDCEGNTHDWVHTVTIEREDFTVPANTSETVACYADIVLPAPPAVNDHCGNPITPTGPVESTPPACEGDITYTWTYTDCEGNTHDWVHTVTIEREDFTVPANTSETVACYADIVLPAPPAVNDHCGNPITPTGPVESTPPACEGDINYTWTYTDCEGNTHDWIHTVTIEREDFTVPANTSETVACYADIVLPAPPAVNDHCGNPVTPTGPVESTPPACEGDITYTWTYTDCEGNTHDWVHTVTIEREDFTVPANTSETVACYADIVLPAPPAVNDHCGNPITPTGPVESTPPACEGNITYTWTYTDCEGNTHDWVHTVTIEREDFTVPANTSETVACYADIVLPAPPAVNDHCGDPITPTGPVESTVPACEGDITYTWTYTDCEGNTHDWVHTVTIEREDFTVPANTSETVACYADIVLPAPPAVNDHCGNPITPTGPVESTPPACEGDITYTWTYTDCEGNTHDWVHTVTIEREDFTVPANTSETVACYADIVLPAPPAVNDHCGNPITPTGPVESTPPACEGDITYTWTYTDCEGNTHDWVHTVTIEREDFTVPANTSETVACYADIVLPAPPAVNDHCGNPITPTGPVESTPPACEGDITYTWTYTDCEGNTHNWVHTVTIEREDFTVPANTSETVACYADIVLPAPPAVNDHCGNPITPTGPVESTPPACEGDITYTWTYTDCEGNTHDWVHTVTIEREDFTVPANTSETVACYADIVLPAPPAVNDHCGDPITPTGPVESTVPACEGNITYTWTYTDCEGNTHDWVHTVTIEREDFTVPANTSETVACYADIVLPAPPAVNDHCGNPITPTGPVESTPPACEGDITYTWTYTDCEGNTHDWVHTVTIEREDFTVPANTSETVACYADIVLPAPPAVNDHCGNPITPTGPVESTPPACEGDITYTWTYTDCEGNTHDWVHTVTIEREDFTVPANTSETVACYADIVLPAPPAVNDHCGNPVTPTGPVESTPPACEGDITYTWTYTDCEGNTHDWIHTVTIEREDFTVPTNTSETVACYADIVLPAPPAVNDHCGNPITPTGPVESTPPACEGDITYTWTYTDCEGNTHDWVHTVTIEREDFTIPVDEVLTVSCLSDIVEPLPPTVFDNCGTELLPTGPVRSSDPVCEGDITYTWTYNDCEGNSHDWTYTYTIEFEDFTIPNDESLEINCVADAVEPVPPTVFDNCGTELLPTGPVRSSDPTCEGDITYTWTYTDCEGNSHDWTYTYTIELEDFIIPNDESLEINCVADAIEPVPPVVTDFCGNVITPTGPIRTANPACEGDITYTWTYTDCEGNTHNWVFTYSIIILDFTMPADDASTVNCIADATEPVPPVVTDFCVNNIIPTGPVRSADPACEGDITYTWTYTDCAGNSHNWTYTYTIDIPDFTMPADDASTVNCIADATEPLPPVVTDFCGTNIIPTGPVRSADPACEGDITYIWTYTDCAGNSNDWTYTYTIDIPDFTLPADDASTVNCIADATEPVPPVVTDFCGNNIIPTGPVPSADPACEGDITYTWTYTDCAGNSHDWTYTYTIDIPDFTMPADDASTANCIADATEPVPPVVTDFCGNNIIPTGPVHSADPACEGNITYTWTYADCAGNSHDWTYTYTIDIPDFTMPADDASTVNCIADATEPVPPVVTDFCGNDIIPTGPVRSADPACEGNITYTWTYADCAGNSHDWTYTYTIDIPDFTMPADDASTVNCIADAIEPVPTVVTDFCGNNIIPTGPVRSADPACEGDITYTWTYTDCAGNSHDWTYTYTIDIPDFTMPADDASTVNCIADATEPLPPVVTDFCGNDIMPTGPVRSADPACEGDITYTWTYTDCAGNSHDWTYTYTIDIPDFTMPADDASTVNCIADATEPLPPVVTDFCGNDIMPTGPVRSADPACEGDITYTWTYTDCAGNSHDWTYTYTIDTPDFTLPADDASTVNCIADATEPVPPVVTDFCGNSIVPTGPVRSADPACEGDITYTWTYTDCAGNSHDWTYSYTIELNDFVLPPNEVLDINCIADAVEPTPPAVADNCGNTIIPTTPLRSSDPLCEGPITYTYTYSDCEGNTHDWIFTYNVIIQDFTIPVDETTTVNCIADATEPVPPTVTDFCGNDIIPTGPVRSADPACEGDITYTWTYTDCAGNSHDWTYTYTIDIPDFTMPADDASTVNCIVDAVVPIPPTVTDFCGTNIIPTGPVRSADPACEGDITYTWTYTDCAGNSHDWTYTYTIDIPDFTLPADDASTVNCIADATEPVPPVVTDFCGNSIVPTGPVRSADPACEGDITYTWTYTDCAGNSHDWTYTYTIDIPDFTLPADDASIVNCIADATEPVPPVVTDFCGTNIVPTGPVRSSDPACEGDITYTWTYTDCAGNSHDWTYTYTIDIPDFTLPADDASTVNCIVDAVVPIPPTVTDFCGTNIIPTGPVRSVDPACEGDITYTWTYTDCAGNSHDWTYTYTIDIPDFTMPADDASTVNCIVDAVVPIPPTVTDFCGTNIIPTGPVRSADPACEGDITYTWTYTDCAGNSHDWTYTYTIDIPDFTLPADDASTVNCIADATEPVPPVVTDFCGNSIVPTGPVRSADPACEGDITYTWTYTDCAGNSHDWTYTYTIDIPEPTITCSSPIDVNCYDGLVTEVNNLLSDYNAGNNVTVACNLDFTVVADIPSEDPACPLTYEVIFTLTDDCGGTANCTQLFNIIDENPIFDSAIPADITVACDEVPAAPTINATDDCGDVTVSLDEEIIGDVCSGRTITRTWTAVDECGNSVSDSQVITVDPPVTPTWEVIIDPTLELTCSEADIYVFPSIRISNGQSGSCNIYDLIAPSITGIYDACGGALTAIWEYTDFCGTTYSQSQTVDILPAPAATFNNPPADYSISCEDVVSISHADLTFSNGASGSCLISGTATPSVVESFDICGGTITVTWDVLDDCNNPITHTQVITVTPAEDPQFY
jgi:hypothetical protein